MQIKMWMCVLCQWVVPGPFRSFYCNRSYTTYYIRESLAGRLAGGKSAKALDDILRFATAIGIKQRRALEISGKVSAAVRNWQTYAEAAGIPLSDWTRIGINVRLDLV